jgi:hypothetical protein
VVREMRNSSLARRLERLEAELAPTSDERGLTIEVEFIGSPERNKIIHLRKPAAPNSRRQGPWQANSGRDR